jgi:hypothetical protein
MNLQQAGKEAMAKSGEMVKDAAKEGLMVAAMMGFSWFKACKRN